jgi:hypothetical protein
MVDLNGAPVGVNQYAKNAADANAIYTWDVLAKAATSAAVEGQLLPTPGCKTFAAATPGTSLILGVALNAGKASTATWHTVVDDPNALSAAQVDGTVSVTVASTVGKNANVKNTAQTGPSSVSAMLIDSTTIATTASLDLRIRDFYRLLSNVEGPNAQVEVIFMKSASAQGSAGV